MASSALFPMTDTDGAQTITAVCGCNIGKRRNRNEDNFLFNGIYMPVDHENLANIPQVQLSLDKDCSFAVFDGIGGGDHGEIASFAAAETAKNYLDCFENTGSDPEALLKRLCDEMNNAVFRKEVERESYTMGTTVAGLYFRGSNVWTWNLGDSRCFLLREGILSQISVDHTDEAYMRENGITGRKPYLTQYLGVNPEEMRIAPSVQSLKVKKNDCFLICSDGVTDMVAREDLVRMMSEETGPNESVQMIIDAALDAGGRDNITAIVIRAA